jgi:putative transposase
VFDDKKLNVIPDSMKLIAGRTGQEINQRISRRGAFWEDSYNATAVEAGNGLLQCIIYIDLNMVRAGVVKHPAEWPFSGYNEIQNPKRKYVIINYERLRELLGFDSYDQVKLAHRTGIESFLTNGKNFRDDKWTKSIAVGSECFIDNIQALMKSMALGRKPHKSGESFHLR